MLSPKNMVDLAMPEHKWSRMGTWLAGVELASGSASDIRDCAVQVAVPALVQAMPQTAMTFARPRPQSHVKASLPGFGAQVAAHAEFAAQQQPTSNVSYAYKARIAAVRGGHLGPQPPRDPV